MSDSLENEEGFKLWMKDKGVNKRVAADHISRCKRVQRELNLSIKDSASTVHGYIEMMKDIARVPSKSNNKTSAKGTIRYSVRVYSLFLYPEISEDFPKYIR